MTKNGKRIYRCAALVVILCGVILYSKSDSYQQEYKSPKPLWFSGGFMVEQEAPMNEASVNRAAEKLDELYQTYCKGVSGRVFLSIVPDKGYYLPEEVEMPRLNYEMLFGTIRERMSYAEYIDITSNLELSDYYQTDSHWRQEKITDVAKVFADALGITVSENYEEKLADKPFYGLYHKQFPIPCEGEEIRYLTNDELEGCMVYNPVTQETSDIYNLEKVQTDNLYDIYLSGVAPLLRIDNPNADSERRLVVFRDSFASSLIPLLEEGYSEITLVDTRFIFPDMIGDYVEFDGADVLFLYSVSVVNNSQTLR